ncbi:hypothetical protein MPSI1_003233 [Malassezia psittaci]|uniref:RRM Nup35-type domain-containing protein n=1 Tax=Malassezia psittaci TaxID=1821823 RepID=A0AAF0JFD6_9BASI|nr:hypothetical protein MPSI1_003233 [Malassezia psittaci]
MFSASQHAQSSSPWAHRNYAAQTGGQVGGQLNAGYQTPSFQNPPATPGQAQAGNFDTSHAQQVNSFTPQHGQSMMQHSQPSTPQWGQNNQAAMGSHNQSNATTFSPASQQPLGAQASPMQPGQAPVQYLPGYLSKMRGSERTSSSSYRPTESDSPPARDADTSLSFSGGKDVQGSMRGMPSTSPMNRFSSSFFHTSMNSDDPRTNSNSSSNPHHAHREGSIFGYGGLRGSRKREDLDRSTALQTPTEPPTALLSSDFFGADYNSNAMDDEDAPPAEALSDVAKHAPLASSIATQPSGSMEKATQQAPIAQRVILVYGFPSYLFSRIVDQFSAIGGLQRSEEVPLDHSQADLLASSDGKLPKGALPSVARFTYTEPYQALMAVRRNGQLMGNSCMIGVRWESDALHQLSLIQGIDAVLLKEQDSKPSAFPSTPSSTLTPAQKKDLPQFGRPIDLVDTPVTAINKTSHTTPGLSPLRAAVHATEALWRSNLGNTSSRPSQPGIPPASKSFVGKLADGLFGQIAYRQKMSAYGAVARESGAIQKARIYGLSKRVQDSYPYTHLVCIHVRRDGIPPGLENAMRASFNETIAEGDTYPFRDAMDQNTFGSYFCGYDVVVGILINTPQIAAQDGSEVVLADLLNVSDSNATQQDLLNDHFQWPAQLGGFYYVKPNYPGRSSHICNAGFIVPKQSRGLGLGGLLGRSYLIYAPAFGYEASVFNLVYETNQASAKIWERLGFQVVGRVPRAGLLRTSQDGKEQYADALVIYKDFTSHST